MSLCLILKSTWFFCVIFKTVIIAHDPNFSQFIWSRPKFRECKIFCVNGYLEGIEKGKAFPV